MKKKNFKIGILDFTNITAFSSDPSPTTIKEIQMLRAAIKSRGHKPVIYKVGKCQLYFHARKSEILYNSKKIKGCDVLIPRFSPSFSVDLEVSVLKQFQMMNIPVINKYLPIVRAKNKLRTLQILTRRQIAVPKTIVVRKLEFIDEAIHQVGGYPVILKTPYGSYGSGVVLVESRRSLYSALDVIWRVGDTNIILIQEYVAEADGSDFRAFVLGNNVVASMKRKAKEGEFRSNLHLGGEAEKAELTDAEKKLAIKSTEVLGLRMSGVDIMRSKYGSVIIEVNANPGFVGLAKITGVDVAGAVVDYAVEIANNARNDQFAKRLTL